MRQGFRGTTIGRLVGINQMRLRFQALVCLESDTGTGVAGRRGKRSLFFLYLLGSVFVGY
jgi:hypothetical protein